MLKRGESVSGTGESAAGKILSAAAFAMKLGENLFEQGIHVFCGCGALREDDSTGFGVGKQSDCFFAAAQSGGQMLEIVRLDGFEELGDDAEAIGARTGISEKFGGFGFGQLGQE